MNIEMNLPAGWKSYKFKDAVNILDNLRKPINSSERQKRIGGKTQKELYPYYGATGQVGWIDDYITDGEYILIGEDGAPFLDFYKSKAYLVNGKTWVNNHAHVLKEKAGVSINKYILNYLNSINYHDFVNGTTRLKLTKGSLENIPFLAPSVDEQNLIVEKIEELFSELDKGIENLKIAQQQLKVYRQAVLKWAFEGKLTRNDKGWKEVKLGTVAFAIDPQPSHRTPPKADQGIPFVSTKDFDHDTDTIVFDHARIVPSCVLDEHLERYELQLGDFVIGKIGTIGKPVRIVLPQNYALSANIVLIQPRKVNPTYLYYFFQSSLIEKAFLAGQSATSQAAFGIQKVRELDIKLPSDTEQLEIVQEIESRLSVCDKMEETITNSLQQAEALKQSILKRAFEGKLVKVEENKAVNLNTLITSEEEKDWERKVLAGKIIEICHDDNNFGHTKFQKTLHLCEYHAQLDFNANYVKEAAGPFDHNFFFPLIEEAKINNWFYEKPKRKVIFFQPGSNITNLTANYDKYFKDHGDKIQFVIDLLKDKDTFQSELLSTIYAIWNNYLIKKGEINSDQLVAEVYDWSESKVKFSEDDVVEMWKRMKEAHFSPVGFGNLITNKKN